jgi:hypothetical protein
MIEHGKTIQALLILSMKTYVNFFKRGTRGLHMLGSDPGEGIRISNGHQSIQVTLPLALHDSLSVTLSLVLDE